MIRVTAYDAFGNIYKSTDLENYPSHYNWPAVVLPDGSVWSMPAIVVEPLDGEASILNAHYIVELLSYNGTVIREWETLTRPATVRERCVLICEKGEVWAFGNYLVRAVE